MTTKRTLLSRGDNFFSGLLSCKFPVEKDETYVPLFFFPPLHLQLFNRIEHVQFAEVSLSGAYFLDRNGAYFAPILDFLRTGILYLPPNVPLDCVSTSSMRSDFPRTKEFQYAVF